MSSSWGKFIKINIFGESHGTAVGGIIEGFPSGFQVDWQFLNNQMARRVPGKATGTSLRNEDDEVRVLSGVYEGKTTGTPISFNIENKDVKSATYEGLKENPRPGHSDYTGNIRYKGHNDFRGGGHFSGRLTAPLVFMGALCEDYLAKVHNVKISSNILYPDNNMVEKVMLEGDSIGGLIECNAEGVKPGLGSPMFRGVENIISSIMFGIPAVKGVEFGKGFDLVKMKGSEANDEFNLSGNGPIMKTNNCGGILGGITTGMPINLKVAIKPTPTVKMMNSEGRHDSCIALRAPVIIEGAVAIALMDIYMEAYGYVS